METSVEMPSAVSNENFSDGRKSLLEDFVSNTRITELAVVDDLWYFVKKGGNWIVGSG